MFLKNLLDMEMANGHSIHVSPVFPRPKRRKRPSQLRREKARALAHREKISQQEKVENTLLLPPPLPPPAASAGQSPAVGSSPIVSTPSMSNAAEFWSKFPLLLRVF